MTKKVKTLSEAAAEILGGSISAARAKGDQTFGSAGHTPAIGHQPAGSVGNAAVPSEQDGKEKVELGASGIGKAIAAAPTASYPGPKPPVGKETGGKLPGSGQGGQSINASGVAEETEVNEEENEVNEDAPLTEEEIEEVNAVVGEEKDEEEKDDDKDDDDVNEETVDEETPPAGPSVAEMVKEAVTNYKIDVSADVKAMFEGVEVPPEFIAKATSIFETAVKTTALAVATPICEETEQAYVEKLSESTEAIFESVSEKVDDYLNYVVEEWVKENEVAVDTGLRTELTEEFIVGLKNLFIEHYIDIPEDKVNVVEEMNARIVELEEKINEETARGVELTKKLNEAAKTQAVNEALVGLSDVQAEKLKSLVENVAFTNADEFTGKIKELKESYFPANAPKIVVSQTLHEGVEIVEDKTPGVADPVMDMYVKAISKTKNE